MFVVDKVKEIIVEQFGVDVDEVIIEVSFIDDFGVDFFDIVEFVMVFEEEFGIEIFDEDVEKISCVNEVVNYIEVNKG